MLKYVFICKNMNFRGLVIIKQSWSYPVIFQLIYSIIFNKTLWIVTGLLVSLLNFLIALSNSFRMTTQKKKPLNIGSYGVRHFCLASARLSLRRHYSFTYYFQSSFFSLIDVRAVSEHFFSLIGVRAVSEQFQSCFFFSLIDVRTVSEQFQSSFGAVSEHFFSLIDVRAFSGQFQGSYSAVSEQHFSTNRCKTWNIDADFQRWFRAVSEQFRSSFSAVFFGLMADVGLC